MPGKGLSLDYGWASPDLTTQLQDQGWALEEGSWGPPTFHAIKECFLQGMITRPEMKKVTARFQKDFLKKAKLIEV